MCGIVAILSDRDRIEPEALRRATHSLIHRGPDEQHQWIASHGRVGLGHTRLTIIDLVTGAQPMANEDGQLHIVVNGEFYDFERIRSDLESRGLVVEKGSPMTPELVQQPHREISKSVISIPSSPLRAWRIAFSLRFSACSESA